MSIYTEKIQIRLSRGLLRALRERAREEGMTVSEMIRWLIRQHLREAR